MQGGKSLVKKIFLTALALGASLTAFGTPVGASAPTQACPPQDFNPDCFDANEPQGQKCRANTSTDVTAEAQTQAGVIEIGPLVITSASGSAAAWCQIYVDGVAHPDTLLEATVTGAGTTYVAAGARTLSYGPVYIGTEISMCTFASYNGQTHYWRPGPPLPATPQIGDWAPVSPGFDYKLCAQSTQIDPNPPVCPILLTIDKYTNNAARLAETWQDCEPYSPII